MIRVGQKVKFDPWKGQHSVGISVGACTMDGVVVCVHPGHHWFTVEYETNNHKFRTSYHFCEAYGKNRCVTFVN